MEILPSLLSFIDSQVRTFKRKVSDAAENPGGVAEQVVDNAISFRDELWFTDPELRKRYNNDMALYIKDNPTGGKPLVSGPLMDQLKDPANFIGGGAGTLISRGAKSWNQPRYIEAVKMKVEGANRDEIWAKTKTWLDTPDMLPRQEISDLDMKIRGWEHRGGGFFRKIGSFHSAVEHPLLTSAHPELLRDLQVAFTKSPDQSVWGKYTPEQNLIQVSGKTDQDILYVLSHELQHVIQDANRFANGGSPKAITLEMQPLFMKVKDEMLQRGDPENYATEQAANIAYRALAGEAEARAVMDRLLEGLNTGKHPEVGPWKHYDVDPKNTIVHFYNRK